LIVNRGSSSKFHDDPDILIVSRVAFLAIAYLLSSGWAHLAASYTQKLWMRVKRKAAYLPG